ncbi:MAG: glycosyltransferase, partial [Rhodospirillaceae bacterium]
MKILIVSWYFPPCNTMGALRIGKLAKFLLARGHDVRVVCARDQPHAMTLPVEVPQEIVFDSRWGDVNVVPVRVQSLRVWLKKLLSRGGAAGSSSQAPSAEKPTSAADGSAAPPGLLRRCLAFYQHATNIPDGMIGWLPHALKAGRRATAGWRPDVVFASAPPFTSLLAGRAIARRTGAPLIVEYRDRWIEDPYGHTPSWRRWMDERLENWCIRPARGVVTVSDPWKDDYSARWGKPVVVA